MRTHLTAFARALLLALSLSFSLPGCGSTPESVAPIQPSPGPALKHDQLPTPPVDPGHPAPPRTTSAGDLQFDSGNVFDYTDNGETGDKGGGTFAVLPGGEDDLDSAWVVFEMQLAADDRPVAIDLGSTQAALPGGEDDLELSYWLGAYSFSQSRWDWLDPPPGSADLNRAGAWNAEGSVEVPLNGEELRQRYCNVGGEVYFCVLVEPKGRAGAWCGVTIQPSTLAFADKNAAGYFKTQPLPSTIDSATGDSGSGTITLVVPQGEAGEADRTYIERRETSGTSSLRGASAAGSGWQALGYLPKGVTTYVDPADNANPALTMPKPGKDYEYRATAAVLANNRAYRARHSNRFQGKLAGWSSFVLRTGTNNDPCLLNVNGNPALAYVHNPGSGPELIYDRATSTDGANASDWSSGWSGFTPPGGTPDIQPALAVVLGRPALTWRNTITAEVEYAWASISTGMNAWNPEVVVSGISENGYHPSLAVIQGKPAIAYYDAGLQHLQYSASDTVNGVDQADWPGPITADGPGVGNHPALAEVDGRPAIAYRRETPSLASRYALAATDGRASNDWTTTLNLNSFAESGCCNVLLVFNGSPAMSYYSLADGSVNYWRANNVDGSAPANWQACVTIQTGVDVPDASGSNLAIIAGKPVIAYSEGGQIKVARATDANNPGFEGDTLDDWAVEPTTFQAQGKIAIAEIDGRLAMAWVDAATLDLYYAIGE